MVLGIAHTPLRIVTDCMANRRTLLDGEEAATAAGRMLARVWTAIFACCEGRLRGELDAVLTWAPAHTSWATLASRMRADGLPITAQDWRANSLADALAKMAARATRAPWSVRKRCRCLQAARRYGAAIAGVACQAANNYVTYGHKQDGTYGEVKYRDSSGRPNAAQISQSGHSGP